MKVEIYPGVFEDVPDNDSQSFPDVQDTSDLSFGALLGRIMVESSRTEFERVVGNYIVLHPEDIDIAQCNYEESATDEDRIAACTWAIENNRRYWEYPDIHPELVPGYWEQWHKDHPGAII